MTSKRPRLTTDNDNKNRMWTNAIAIHKLIVNSCLSSNKIFCNWMPGYILALGLALKIHIVLGNGMRTALILCGKNKYKLISEICLIVHWVVLHGIYYVMWRTYVYSLCTGSADNIFCRKWTQNNNYNNNSDVVLRFRFVKLYH